MAPYEIPQLRDGGHQIIRLAKDANGRQLLERNVTGERVLLETGVSWSLGYKGNWAYVVGPGQSPRWCTSLFTMSVWMSDDNKIHVQTKHGSGADVKRTCCWLSEMQAKRTTYYVFWNLSDLQKPMPSARVLKVMPPRSGSYDFYCVKDFQDAAGFATSHTQSTKWVGRSMASWLKFVFFCFECVDFRRTRS